MALGYLALKCPKVTVITVLVHRNSGDDIFVWYVHLGSFRQDAKVLKLETTEDCDTRCRNWRRWNEEDSIDPRTHVASGQLAAFFIAFPHLLKSVIQ